MNNKFLKRVLNKILSEIRIDNRVNKIHFPFFSMDLYHLALAQQTRGAIDLTLNRPFVDHCRNVYGLRDEEIDYLWSIFKNIVKDSYGE